MVIKIKKNKIPKFEKVNSVENYNGIEIYINYSTSMGEFETFVAYEDIENEEKCEKLARQLAKKYGVEYNEYYGD